MVAVVASSGSGATGLWTLDDLEEQEHSYLIRLKRMK